MNRSAVAYAKDACINTTARARASRLCFASQMPYVNGNLIENTEASHPFNEQGMIRKTSERVYRNEFVSMNEGKTLNGCKGTAESLRIAAKFKSRLNKMYSRY